MPNRFELLVPDVVGSFERGRGMARQAERERLTDQEMRAQIERGNRLRELAPRAYTAATPGERQQYLSEVAALDPQAAATTEKQFGSQEDRKQERLGLFARVLTSIPEENNSARMLMYQQMRPEMLSLGIDAPPEYTPEVGQMAQRFMAATQGAGQTPARVAGFQGMTQGMSSEDVERARRVELGLEGRAASGGFGFRTVTLPDGRETLVVTDPRTGQVRQATAAEAQAFMGAGAAPGQSPGAPGGPAFVGPTPGQIEADKAQGKAGVELETAPEIARQTQAAGATGKAGAERQAGFIDEGLRAADSIPVINRAMELLDSVSTGGLDAAKLAATNFFGITGADEGELSNNLGKAVLSQLRATFGAAFTEKEGARLSEIESGFGKSTAVNRRLLGQTKAIVERAARRGIEAARSAGDEFTAQEIERALRMTLVPGQKPAQQPRQTAAAPPSAAPASEVTATGPNGQKLVLRNGQWQPLQ